MAQVASISFVPNGQSLTVDLTGPGSAVEAFYTDTALSAAVTLPATVTSNTTWYTGNFGGYTLSVKQQDGTELRGDVVRIAPDAPTVIEPLPTLTQMASDSSRAARLVSGNYYFTSGQSATTTASMGANNVLKVVPWRVPSAVTLSKIGCEVTTAGEAGSKVRLGIYADASGVPGALVVDGGQINGDSNTVQEATINVSLDPGLYWIGAAAQSAPTTRPTVRASLYQYAPEEAYIGQATIPGTNDLWYGYGVASVSGALPSTFGTPILQTATAIIRVFVKVA